MVAFILRCVVAFGLLAATFNPTRWSYTRWVRANFYEEMPLAVLMGLVLLVGYIIYLRATLRSIGALGMTLVLSLVASLLWVLDDYDLLALDNPAHNTWLALAALSLVLGIGLSWSHVRRRLSGQADMDDIDE